MSKNCAVLGGAGFIGHHLAKKLKDLGHAVYIIDNLSTGSKGNVEYANPDYFYKDDITDYSELVMSFQQMEMNGHGIDWIFHLAALPRVQFSIAKPRQSNKANVEGTLNAYQMAAEFGAEKVVFSSSSSVYGNQGMLPLNEDMPPSPMSPYAAQKLYGEQLAKQYQMHYRVDIACLRYFNVYGPRQRADSSYAAFIPKFIESYLNDQRPTIFGDGNQTRDFTYVDDVVNANILAAQSDVKYAVFNIGAGNNQSVNDIDLKIREIIGPEDGPIYADPVIEPRDTLAKIQRAKLYLQWEPKTDIDTGLMKTIKSFNKEDCDLMI